jgi:predicted extracellular nuclease
MIRIPCLLYAVFFLTFIPLYSQNDQFTIVFYNVENLFDTINNQGEKDIEFTPQSEKNWNSEKYFKKLDDIARVLCSVFSDDLPDIAGLAEIENLKVLEDLLKRQPLAKVNYGIVHKDSNDPRGIDVALLYKKNRFTVTSHKAIEVIFPFDSAFKTRDILQVTGTAPDGKSLHIFVNHWVSRTGGIRKTEPGRMHSAVALRRNIDLLLTKDNESRIVVIGDFNDEPTNQSIMHILQATNKRKNTTPGDLYNLFYDYHNLDIGGSYYYQNSWIMPDHIIISRNLLNRKGLYSCSYDSGKVYKADWMLIHNKEGISVPWHTYGGNAYLGGVSDHLPVYVTFSR